jgi:hypothetical protein
MSFAVKLRGSVEELGWDGAMVISILGTLANIGFFLYFSKGVFALFGVAFLLVFCFSVYGRTMLPVVKL